MIDPLNVVPLGQLPLPTRPSNASSLAAEIKTSSTITREKALALVLFIKTAILEAGGQVDLHHSLGQSTSSVITARAKTLPLLQAVQKYARTLGIEGLKEDLKRQIEKRTVDMPPNTIADRSQVSENDTTSPTTTHSDSEPPIRLATIGTDTGTPPVDDSTPPPETDPLAAFKTAVFGKNFKEVLSPDPAKILRALERGEFVPDETPLEAAVHTLAGYMADTGAKGRFSISYDINGEVVLEVENSADTEKLIQILELALTEDKEVDVTSRESGRRLVDIMTKHTIYYLQHNGFLRDGEPVDPHQLKQALYKVMVAKGKETGLNAGIIFEIKPEEAQRDLAEFQRSLTLADQLFFGKIFDSGKCRRPAVFEKVIEQLTASTTTEEGPKPSKST